MDAIILSNLQGAKDAALKAQSATDDWALRDYYGELAQLLDSMIKGLE